jgi:lipopolysaccharide biosynthesis regulator YciM
LNRTEVSFVLSSLGEDYRRAGILDRASRAFDDAMEADSRNIHAVAGHQKLLEDQGLWNEAAEERLRLSRLRRSDDSLVLAFLRTEEAHAAARAGRSEAAEHLYRQALALDTRLFPARLGLAAVLAPREPLRAAEVLEKAVEVEPQRAYLAFDALLALYLSRGEPRRFEQLCERLIRQDSRDWRARLALARHLRTNGRPEEAHGLLLRAVEANPQVLLIHLEMWKTLGSLGELTAPQQRYVEAARQAVFYPDPHVCTTCHYRAQEMLWRCPHCHEWGSFVEERLAPGAGPR